MSIISKLQNLQKNIYFKRSKSLFSWEYETQRKKLISFTEPKSLMERSFYQYKCQMSSVPFLMRLAQNFISIFMLFYYLLKPYKRIYLMSEINHQNVAVFLREGITTTMIPNSVITEFELIHECPLKGELYLNNKDKKVILSKIMKYWYQPFFCLKCVVKMGIYSSVIHTYKPSAIITHNEYSFASSCLTMYCNQMNVEHINIMHGEKLFNIRDSFVSFNRYYVWDKHYIDLIAKLRAMKNQFIVEVPSSMDMEIDINKEYIYLITYYLGAENESELLKIKNSLVNVDIPFDKICIRYHPRYSVESQIRKVFVDFKIENPWEVPLNVSLSSTKYVTSLYSTVLYQAYFNGKNIVIDDLSNSNNYNKLKSLMYIMISKPHLKLSALIKNKIY